VGVLVQGDRTRVIHASQSRQRVVEDDLERFTADAIRVERVPLPSILAYHESNLGRPALELPEPLEPSY
jgi:hypothetical protein